MDQVVTVKQEALDSITDPEASTIYLAAGEEERLAQDAAAEAEGRSTGGSGTGRKTAASRERYATFDDAAAAAVMERHPEVEGYCSRTVDLDLLYYGDRVVLTPMLTIPHPRLHLRRFALVPLCDVIPDFRHPVFQLTQVELLQRCQDGSVVRELYVEKED